MADIFLKIVNMSISACWIVLAIVLLRIILKKAPKWVNCVLWGIAGLRLIMPFSFESVFSLIPSAETIRKPVDSPRPQIESGVTIIDNQVNSYLKGNYFEGVTRPTGNFVDITTILAIVWVVGIVVLLFYTAVSFIRLKGKIGTAVLLRDNIYQSEAVVSPFVLGIIKPKIYLPFNMSEQDMEHVVAHEQAHLRRKDHLWKPLGFLILTLHWFNPMVWLGYILLCRDIELACDEKVVKELNNEQRADYSQALLTCSVNRRMIAACPLAFGEVGVKDRVKSVLNYKKPAFWVIIVAVIASLVTSICFLTNPITHLNDELSVFIDGQVSEHNYTESDDPVFVVLSHKLLDVDKSLNKTTVYMWALYTEYSYENGQIQLETSSYTPTVITAKRTGLHGHYKLVEYWTPRDGSLWVEDIKEKFPWYLHNKALDTQRYIDEQMAFCEKSAKEYFSSESNVGGTDSMLDVAFESTLTYAGVPQDSNMIFYSSLNREKLAISSVRHLPIHRLDTHEDLEQFKATFSGDLTLDKGYDEVSSFNAATTKYDKDFFEYNSLMVVYIDATNSTHRYAMQSVEHSGVFCVHIEETTKAEVVDDALAGWFVTVTASDELLNGCTGFDADFNNTIDLYDGSQIPKLMVSCNGIWAETVKGTTEWTYDNGNGTMQTINGDSAHPTDRIDYLLPIALKVKRTDDVLTAVTMNFDIKPDKIEVNSWFLAKNGNTKPFDAEKKGMDIFLNQSKETCIYEVVATWNSSDKYYGTVRYSFCVSEQEEENEEIALIPMVMVDGVLYIDTGYNNSEIRKCGTPDGEITSQVKSSKKPYQNNQSNFGTGYEYQYGATEGTIDICMNGNWRIFAAEDVRQKLQFPDNN